MAVMENIRAGANNPWMKAVFAAIVLVFVFWGVGGAGGPTNQVIAEVNGERITDTQFQNLMRNYSRSQGEAKSDEEQSRIAGQAVAELIETEVLQQAAVDNNIEVSDDEGDEIQAEWARRPVRLSAASKAIAIKWLRTSRARLQQSGNVGGKLRGQRTRPGQKRIKGKSATRRK